MQNTQFLTQKNNLNICCIVLSNYDRAMIEQLKKYGFRYFSKTKEWSKTGFNDLSLFDNYCLAVLNNDTKMIKKLEPTKKDLKADIKKLAAIRYKSKKEYIQNKNNSKILELEKIFDKGTAELVCQFCIKNKIDFWSIDETGIKDLILNNIDLLNDIIDFNTSNTINSCKWILEAYNEGLPF